MKLISMVDYVLDVSNNFKTWSSSSKLEDKINILESYAMFLSMILSEEIILNYFNGFYKHHGVLYCPNQVELMNLNEDTFKSWHTIEWILNNSYQEIKISDLAITKYQI